MSFSSCRKSKPGSVSNNCSTECPWLNGRRVWEERLSSPAAQTVLWWIIVFIFSLLGSLYWAVKSDLPVFVYFCLYSHVTDLACHSTCCKAPVDASVKCGGANIISADIIFISWGDQYLWCRCTLEPVHGPLSHIVSFIMKYTSVRQGEMDISFPCRRSPGNFLYFHNPDEKPLIKRVCGRQQGRWH